MSTGLRLSEERRRLNLTQTACAAAGGISRPTQALYETGARPPTTEYLVAVAAHGVDAMYVMFGKRLSDIAESALNEDLLSQIFNEIEIWAESRKKKPSAGVKAELAALFYSQFQQAGEIRKDWMERQFKLVA